MNHDLILFIGLAHRLMEEDTYKGYRIPNGSIVIANSWYLMIFLIDVLPILMLYVA